MDSNRDNVEKSTILSEGMAVLRRIGFGKVFTSAVTLVGLSFYIFAWPPKGVDPFDIVHAELRAKGYHVLVDATNTAGAGMIVSLEEIKTPNGSTRVDVHPACEIKRGELSHLARVSPSSSYSLNVPQTWQEKTFDLIASKLGLETAHAGTRTVSFESPKVHIMSTEQLVALRESLLTGNCEKAVIWNLQSGAKVCQITQAYQASIHLRDKPDDAGDLIVEDLFMGIKPTDWCLKLKDFDSTRVAMM